MVAGSYRALFRAPAALCSLDGSSRSAADGLSTVRRGQRQTVSHGTPSWSRSSTVNIVFFDDRRHDPPVAVHRLWINIATGL
jgi:hypothetical protein